ncbi:MAG: CHAT domain-containing protein, partial [Deltaproteobacteria bacterium]|nr:CHAT domain-containing protein [Deltaproteobacteria bacterium]
GWAQEAKARAEQLRKQAAERTEAWKTADAAGLAWVMTGAAPSEAEVRRFPGLFRLNLYDAVRAAPDAARVNAVRPLAALLDSIYGGHVLSDYVEQVSKADFKVRAPLAAEYAKMRAGTLSWPEQGALFGKTKDAGQADLRMGTLFFTYQIPANLPEYKHLVEQSRDPWFAALAALNEARGVAGSNPLEAEQLLRQALIDAHAAKLDYRAVQLELALADVLASMQRVPEAFAASLRAFKLARSDGEIELEAQAISRLIAAARLRWAFALVRAYAHEATLAKPADCDTQQYAHLNAANAAALELRSAEARAEFDQVKACDGRPLGLHEAGVLADLARLDNHPGDTQRVLEIIKTLRDQNALSPGDKAEADDIAGRALLEQSEAEGKKLLEQSIAAADALGPQDVQGQKARAYSYVSLQLDAARKGRFDEALALLAKEQHVEQPRECALGVGVDDDRSYVIAAGADGKLVGSFEARRAESIETFVPHPNPLQLAALKGCAEVAVLARPPLQGRPGILPPEIAWAFGVKPAHATPSELPRTKRLVVADVEPPASLELPRLASWGRSNEARHDDQIELHGAMATPSRVLQEMEKATEIEIHAHGFVDLAVSDASLLALSPDADGSWALSASQVRSHKLLGHPLVVLGACRAAVGAPQLHAPWSLPAAFREAGASAVLASRADIPDAQARAFFDAVLAGIRSGKPQAVALRDARMEFRSKPQGSWVDSVLLFQ